MRGPTVRRTVWAAPCGLVLLVTAGCSRTRAVEFDMRWSFADDRGYVFLVFEEFPNHHVDLIEPELQRYLEGLDTDVVRVEFEVTTRLGCLERIRETRIGERRDWPRLWAGSGWVDTPDPSPWDRYRCWIPFWRRPIQLPRGSG